MCNNNTCALVQKSVLKGYVKINTCTDYHTDDRLKAYLCRLADLVGCMWK